MVVSREDATRSSYSAIQRELRVCPSCQRPLRQEVRVGRITLRCPDLFHGHFQITPVSGGYLVTYHFKARQLV